MIKRKRQKSVSDIPVSSFSDIAFLLIIFFILTTTMTKEKGFTTDFPSGQVSMRAAQKNPTVAISGSDIRLNDHPLSHEQLFQKLLALKLGEKQKEQDRLVILETQGSLSYQRYYGIMATIAQASGVVAVVKESKM